MVGIDIFLGRAIQAGQSLEGQFPFSTSRPSPTADGGARPDALGDEDEYCGVYPTIDTVTINGQEDTLSDNVEISNGETVTLTFASAVDGEQKPLENIYIDWGDGTAPTNVPWDAEPTTHIFTHAYNCSPDNGARYDDSNQYCLFKPKITIADNWGWCSGEEDGTCSLSYYTEEACTDHGGTWTDGGDHRYATDDVDGSSILSSCQSYDEPNIAIQVNATN